MKHGMHPAAGAAALRRHAVRVSGRGSQAIVFAHGYGCDQRVWQRIAPAFERDYLVVSFDHVGTGAADLAYYDASRHASLDGYADDLLAVLSALDLRGAVYVGHSVSAMIGVLAAIREPERFTKMVMIGPSPCYLNDGSYHGGFARQDMDELLALLDNNFIHWSATMAPVIMQNAERGELAQELANSFCRLDPVVARQFARVTFLSDHRDQLPRLVTPSLILQCRDDAIAPVAVGEYMRRHMPDSTLHLMVATGHCPHMSAPAETIAAIRAFLMPEPRNAR